ncbi:hypothetical protein HQ584_01135 [Patescibacteria group bacterium]|nr:hypothetical protein [Patescibacteria group bacterium]
MGNTHITMCKKGTPDLYAILNHAGGHFLFIEAKRPVGGRQSGDQKAFEKMLKPFNNIHYILATCVRDITKYIEINIDKKQ